MKEINNLSDIKLVMIAWLIMLLISDLPEIITGEVFNIKIAWFTYARIIVLLLVIVISFFHNNLSPLRKYFMVFLVVFMTRELIITVRATEQWTNLFFEGSSSFIHVMIRKQFLLLLAIPFIFLVLLAVKKNPGLFYFSLGDINARVKAVKWLGVNENTYWKSFGIIIGICLTIGMLLYLLYVNGVPTLNEISFVLKYIPVIIIFAAINSFYEELLYRASLLSVLENAIGGKHALYITSLYFGLAHFYGVPAGLIGVLMSGFLAYILGKSMLETRGFFWAFFLHFLIDFYIYIFGCFSFVAN